MTMPTLDEWQRWRAALPPVPDITGRGPTNKAMRETLADVQGHRCAVCLTVSARLVLDHDHVTGLARGMLCRSCNAREGWDLIAYGVEGTEIMVAYRADPPAARAGWIWDAMGSVGRIMLKRARIRRSYGGISVFADADLVQILTVPLVQEALF